MVDRQFLGPEEKKRGLSVSLKGFGTVLLTFFSLLEEEE